MRSKLPCILDEGASTAAPCTQVAIVTLYSPVYNATAGTLTYNITLVPGQHQGGIATFYRRASKLPGFVTLVDRLADAFELNNVALFIDNFQSTDLLSPNPVDNTVIPGARASKTRMHARWRRDNCKESICRELRGYSRRGKLMWPAVQAVAALRMGGPGTKAAAAPGGIKRSRRIPCI